ncbi:MULTISPECIES: universal stress protein [Citrobacter]|uniref:universal stress protein n=1 Tax=Citrobacter TaxID=544 RepID=UPI001B955112|nr:MULTISPECIES: universal stress protein [Citrobacter]MDE9581059.1 universal stress protein [Citrobacter koseri]MDM2975208.1 universal stress protein [Citrobacter sp. CK198]HBC9093219.1 universal stress protein [Citrobacter koseri]HEI8490622.1 universal stress protein [Citrobacter koseri]HEM6874251.1 universal stress protein [Citrobacter koseri]
MNKVILMPVDILAMDLSDKAIAYADHMVNKENGVIHLLHVFPKLGTSPMRGFASDIRKYEEYMTNDAQEKMLNLARKFKTPLENIRFEVRHGNIRDEVNNAVEAHNAEMIIIGSRKPGIATHLLGSAAANILRYAKIPVMVIR